MIGTAQVTPLTMLLHELATNAAKHGAWSRPEGRVAIAWERAANGDLVFSWSESGGPAVAHPASRGYGLRLIEGLASHELGGRAEFEFTERGFVCRLQIPLPH
jgi:two-component sensor histidine kinase